MSIVTKILKCASLVLMLLGVQCLQAQLLSVDINSTARTDNTSPGFVAWNMGGELTGTKQSVTHVFTNYDYTLDPDTSLPIATNISLVVTCTVAMVNPPTASSTVYLNAKNANSTGYSGSPDPSAGWRLPIDGCTVWLKDAVSDQPYTNGGAFSLTIANLPAGVHSITTYHNDPYGPTGAGWHNGVTNISRCIISANGALVFTNTPSIVATNDSKCGFAFFYVTNSQDGDPVVLTFAPDHSSILDFTFLNGFEIDRPNSPGTTATAVFPHVADEHAFANNDVPTPGMASAGYLNLQWVPASFAISNYLYFGTNSNAVLNASVASPEFKTNNAAIPGVTNSFLVTNLNSALTYYWRVDQLDVANGVTNLVKGYVWPFRTRHLAFPGAEGYGRWSRGGRGGVVIEVTNTNDSGPGSYRAAIEASGARTVVFRVAGLIRLQSPCVIGDGYLTVAGQTAPGDGICLANYRAGMGGCSDVSLRFMRCRLGDAAKKAMDGIGLGTATHSIIDHTTLSWTMDESTSSRQSGAVGTESAMITFQHNLISEPLQYSYHYSGQSATSTNYEPHAFAGSISGEIGSYHHNLIAHSTDRNWSLAGGLDKSVHYAGSLDIRNNVVYNFRGRTTDGGVARLNYVNNYYKPAPTNFNVACSWLLRLDAINTNWGSLYIYMTNNVWQGRSYYPNNWMAGSFANGLPLTNLVVTNVEIFPSYVDTQTASNAYKVVLSDAGCNLQLQDAIDRRVIGEAIDGTTHYRGTNGNPYIIDGVIQSTGGSNYMGFIDSQNDVKDFSSNPAATNYSPNAPWPPYYAYDVPLDTDHDGMPDWWERIKGFNTNSSPDDFSDSNGDPDGDGYTNLEDYLNWLALPHHNCTNGTPLSVDLNQYTRGFTNLSPTYAAFGAVNGTVGVSGRTALFTNGVATDALGAFKFKVTDSTGFAYTNTVNVRLIPTNAVNTAPVFTSISSNRTINVGVNLLITNAATDSDALTYSLLPGGPTNSTIGAVSGVLNWRPMVTQADSTNVFMVMVADNGSPSLSATQTFNVFVTPLNPPIVSPPHIAAGLLSLNVDGQIGPDYAVQGSTNLLNWDTLLITNPAAMPFNWSTNVGALPVQYYRIKVGPPLP